MTHFDKLRNAIVFSPNYTSGLLAQNLEVHSSSAGHANDGRCAGGHQEVRVSEAEDEDGAEVDILTFHVQFTDWSPEVPENERLDGDGKQIDITKKSARMDYWDNERGRWDLAQFLLSCGLKGNVEAAIPQAVGSERGRQGRPEVHRGQEWPRGSTVFNLVALVGQAG